MEVVPGNAVARASPTLTPNETLLAIFRWLQRYDLDSVQLASKRLQSLVEKNEMPARILDEVTYIGDAGEGDSVLSKNILLLRTIDWTEKCQLNVEGGIDKARRYLTSSFVRILDVKDHYKRLPNPQLLTAREVRIGSLSFERCNFKTGTDNALEQTLLGSRFSQLYVANSKLPGWQVNDDLLHKLCCAGCVLVDLGANAYPECAVTDAGILEYCFSSDLGALKDRGRTLFMSMPSITPALPAKCIQASLESKVTGRVELGIHKNDYEHVFSDCLAAFGENLVDTATNGAGCQSRIYEFLDGNGMRLQIHFKLIHSHWSMEMRRANKDDEDFFISAWDD
ncbi:hypothetical protein AAVH_18241 [Aphelenchoides avenae]|nr:hypothetical protein AAVH_18241 [Aphelenchus avenae]